jgi:hypothetical protein
MAAKTPKKKSPDNVVPFPAQRDFKNPRMDLFQSFLCNGDAEHDQLSNTLDLWDSVPRYSVSRQAMNKMRTEGGFLELLKLDFQYRGTPMKAVIQPARIEEEGGTTRDYYPSANEELVEDALRKIAAEQNQGYLEQPNRRSGVVFTLHQLRQELQERGHARSYQEIIQSLAILVSSSIKLLAGDGNAEGFAVSNYLSGLAAVSRQKLNEDPEAKWIAQFHPLVTQSMESLAYRQFNYHRMMSHSTQLARWLHKQLSLKFTFAGIGTKFDLRYSTVKRDSGLLEGYARQRDAINALESALAELKANRVLMLIEKQCTYGARCRLEDVVYSLFASLEFIAEAKAANKRHAMAKEKLLNPPETPGPPEKKR